MTTVTQTNAPVPHGMRAGIGYIRVSRKNGREGDSYITKEIQQERIEALAKANGVVIVSWIVDEDESGKKWERGGFQQALAALRAFEADVMVVARMSRFARRVLDVQRGLEQLESRGNGKQPAQLIAGDLNIDTSTKEGRLMRTILAAIAEFELEALTEQWAETRGRAIGNGVYARKPPVGYFRDERKHLQIDETVAPLVAELFVRRAGGASWRELMTWWLGAGGPPLSRQGLASILQNRVYLGEVIEAREVIKHDPALAIVTEEQFEAVQGAKPKRAPRRGEGSLLAGILTCSGCGRPMTTGIGGHGIPVYRCQRHHVKCEGTICQKAQTLKRSVADRVVEQAFLEWSRAQKELVGDPDDEALLARAIQARDEAAAELEAFSSLTSAAKYPELFTRGLEEREAALEAAQAEVDRLRASGRVEAVRQSAAELWADSTTQQRRILLAGAVKSAVVHPAGRGLGRGASEEALLAAVRERIDLTFRS